eukprot:Gb_09375 [translate_table: standard]
MITLSVRKVHLDRLSLPPRTSEPYCYLCDLRKASHKALEKLLEGIWTLVELERNVEIDDNGGGGSSLAFLYVGWAVTVPSLYVLLVRGDAENNHPLPMSTKTKNIFLFMELPPVRYPLLEGNFWRSLPRKDTSPPSRMYMLLWIILFSKDCLETKTCGWRRNYCNCTEICNVTSVASSSVLYSAFGSGTLAPGLVVLSNAQSVNAAEDPANKKEIVCDENLKSIFAGRERVGFLEVAKLMNPHFIKNE